MEQTNAQAQSEYYAQRLAELLKVETVSKFNVAQPEKFRAFHAVLRKMFPNIFAACEFEDFDGSILMRWPGKADGSPAESKPLPVLFMNHHDVVEPNGEWLHAPFGGEIADGKVWGRGALDTKGGLWAMLQAADELAAEGFVPDCDIYFESACTEEVDGKGCERIVEVLKDRGTRFAFSVDEGGMIMYDPIGGADGTFAMVGLGEKTTVSLKIIARSAGGHASTPEKNTPLVRLGRFMAAMDVAAIFPVYLSPVIAEMLQRMAPTMNGTLEWVFAQPQRFRHVLETAMPKVSGTAAALLKTTIAFTMAQGSEGYNVLPSEAWVVANMRCSHHQGVQKSIDAVTRMAKRYDLDVEILERDRESPLSDFDTPAFALVERAVNEVFPGVITAPYIMTACSDSRFVSEICDNCLRFTPFTISEEQKASIHGVNENVDVACLEPAVRFYKYMMEHACLS